jgi:CheY-like chemotaxis protein
LINLLSNGIKYNRPGGRVTIRATADETDMVITVTDDGLGMSREQQQRLFKRFERLGREASAVQGTGLGLALTQQLVKLMQGKLQVDSVQGEGTQVSVRLPLADPAATAADAETAVMVMPSGHVLYIEDDPINALLVQEALRPCPALRLDVARNAREGLACLHEGAPDLLLLDMDLPDMSGLELLRHLRQQDPWRDLRVVVLSGSNRPEDVRAAQAAGAVAYWTKPLALDQLTRQLGEQLRAPAGAIA